MQQLSRMCKACSVARNTLKRKGAQFSLKTAPSLRCSVLGSPHSNRRAASGAYGMGCDTAPIKVGPAVETRAALKRPCLRIEVSKTLISSGHQFLVTFVADPGDISD